MTTAPDVPPTNEQPRETVFRVYATGTTAAEAARQAGVTQQTAWNWLSRAGKLRPTRKAQIADEAAQKYLDGETYQEVADHFGVSRATIYSIANERGIAGKGGRSARDNSNYEEARRRYAEGQTYTEIARTLKISPSTVAGWTDDIEGGAELAAKKDRAQALASYAKGATIETIAKSLGRSVNTVSGWLHEEGVEVLRGVDRMTDEQRAQYSAKGVAARQANAQPPAKRICAYTECGTEFELPAGRRTSRQIYCSRTCGGLARRDPDRRRTFACDVCGAKVERFASVNARGRYCSRTCYFKRNNTVDKFQDWQGNILDSSWEALFLGLCGLLKVPVERYDREQGIAWNHSGWYAPDFWMPTLNLAVEIKGNEDSDDRTRWDAFAEQRGKLAVIDQIRMDRLRSADSAAQFTDLLSTFSRGPTKE